MWNPKLKNKTKFLDAKKRLVTAEAGGVVKWMSGVNSYTIPVMK